MLFHQYLEQLLGNKASISILRALYKYKGKVFTVRGLADSSNVSVNETALTVDQMEKFGIVRIQPVGRAHQVTLNYKSYMLNKIVEPIFIAESKTLDELILVLKKHLTTKKIIAATIFGSVAKGEEKEDSDVDLLVISDDFTHATLAISNASEEAISKFYGKISPLILSKKEFVSKRNSALIRSILENHIMITGIKLRDMI